MTKEREEKRFMDSMVFSQRHVDLLKRKTPHRQTPPPTITQPVDTISPVSRQLQCPGIIYRKLQLTLKLVKIPSSFRLSSDLKLTRNDFRNFSPKNIQFNNSLLLKLPKLSLKKAAHFTGRNQQNEMGSNWRYTTPSGSFIYRVDCESA